MVGLCRTKQSCRKSWFEPFARTLGFNTTYNCGTHRSKHSLKCSRTTKARLNHQLFEPSKLQNKSKQQPRVRALREDSFKQRCYHNMNDGIRRNNKIQQFTVDRHTHKNGRNFLVAERKADTSSSLSLAPT